MSNWTETQVDALVEMDRENAIEQTYARKARGRIRQPKGMNSVERQYAAHLEAEKRAGDVLWYRFEGVTLKLGDDCRFTPDFAVLKQDGSLELHDTKKIWKGHSRPHVEDDATVKLRTAAEMYPITIRTVWPTPEGRWDSKEY